MPARKTESRDVNWIGEVPDDEPIEFTVIVGRKNSDLPDSDKIGSTLPRQRAYLSREVFGELYGASAQDMARVANFLQASGISKLVDNRQQRTLHATGKASDVNRLFGVNLHAFDGTTGGFRAHADKPRIPDAIAAYVDAVLGLDTRPVARLHGTSSQVPESFNAVQLTKRYNFPPGDGSGQTVGIIALAGGYNPRDLDEYFARLGLPVPEIVEVAVDGGCASPRMLGRMETTLDIEVAGAVVPGARLVVYQTPDNSARSFYNAISNAIHDRENCPSVISCSFGGVEEEWQDHDIEVSWSRAGLEQVAKLLASDAVCLGVSFVAASGDYGSSVCIRGGYFSAIALVDFPASSPYALGCGGSHLTSQEEIAWNELAARTADPKTGVVRNGGATSGGASVIFPRPHYQDSACIDTATHGAPGRGVPDLAAHAASSPGYFVVLGGEHTSVGGTSAATPLIAGLLARINAEIGTAVGFINPLLYRFQVDEGKQLCRQVSGGCNGAFSVGDNRPWNACTGLGSPDGLRLLHALRGNIA